MLVTGSPFSPIVTMPDAPDQRPRHRDPTLILLGLRWSSAFRRAVLASTVGHERRCLGDRPVQDLLNVVVQPVQTCVGLSLQGLFVSCLLYTSPSPRDRT